MSAELGISDFYKNKNILITGATGLLGKALVEKMLRSLPELKTLFLTYRNKSEQHFSERYFNNNVFARLKIENPNYKSKVIWLECDIRKPYLGLSCEDLNTVRNNVNIIFHAAALVSFSTRTNIITTNLFGTYEMLKIAAECVRIDSFIYVSSVISNGRKSIKLIQEKIYSHPIAPKKLIHMNNAELQEIIDNKSISDWHNLYAYCKNAEENLVHEYKNVLPVAIFRLVNIIHSFAEPFPYWIEHSEYGMSRYLEELENGLEVPIPPTLDALSVPIDFNVNALIAVACNTKNHRNETIVYNFSSCNNPINVLKVRDYYLESIENNIKMNSDSSKLKRFKQFEETTKNIISHNFVFCNNNIDKLWRSLTEEEQIVWFFNVNVIDWKEYYANMPKQTNIKICNKL